MICQKCGHGNDSYTTFCEKCGTNIRTRQSENYHVLSVAVATLASITSQQRK